MKSTLKCTEKYLVKTVTYKIARGSIQCNTPNLAINGYKQLYFILFYFCFQNVEQIKM